MIIFDTETCGLHGMAVLIQWAIYDKNYDLEVNLHDVWLSPISETLELLELFANHPGGVCGFNLAFDWFHIVKLYTVLSLVEDKSKLPIDCIDEIAQLEPLGCDGPCIKPVSALDLMLVAKRGKYQSTMERKDVRIKKVPKTLSHILKDYLNKHNTIKPIYFARSKDPYKPWHVNEHKDKETGKVLDDFDDVVLKFAPSGALKTLYADIFDLPFGEVVKFADVELPKNLFPTEVGYMPYAKAVESGRDPVTNQTVWRNAWPALIRFHIDHWRNNTKARKYAEDDVRYTTKIYEHFNKPEMGDDDSVLACAVACNRWRGFKVDIDALKVQRDAAEKLIEKVPIAGNAVKDYILGMLDDDEKVTCHNSTKKQVLEQMVNWFRICPLCEDLPEPNEDCLKCGGKGKLPHPVAVRAKRVNEARAAKKEIELYDKIIKAGRFHASFKVIGALSGRMSGADDLNPQGVNSKERIRACFKLAHDGMKLTGGDFESFEVVIAVASYKDPKLEADLKTYGLCDECLGCCKELVKHDKCKGKGCSSCNRGKIQTSNNCPICKGAGQTRKKIHGIFGAILYNSTYDEIVATKGSENDLYKKSKQGVFSQMYGGNEYTLMDRLGLSEDDAKNGAYRWATQYQGVAKAQQETVKQFQTMRQEALGRKIFWSEPADKVESLLGFPRFFTLENDVARNLFKLAENPPKEWTNIRVNVVRRDRLQTASGAVRSAIFGAGFNIQSANTRAAINHRIQSTGAEITKRTQRKIWDLQPSGIHKWCVQVLNIHDEIMTPCLPEYVEKVNRVVHDTVESYRPIIPLISIDWSDSLGSWADK